MAELSAPADRIERVSSLERADRWWLVPAVTTITYSLFILYGLLRVFENNYDRWGPYLAPFYSPELPFSRWLGLPLSAAFYVAWVPLGFRATCYYYRKSYYRAFFWDPPACAVREPRRHYRGETAFPFILSNFHRFFLYTAIVISLILWYDAFSSLSYNGQLHVGLGTVILFVNALFIALYTFSCHSFRHLSGGNVDCYSCAYAGPDRHSFWTTISRLNKQHGLYAWVSMFTVWGADLYVRMLAAGVITDPRFI
ncbi:MAG TPA: succinate dehydrogenase [Chloroflexota bacterium]|jgi:hypothetical protein|nr:succinate dehydrogenase [Chloroflexota bacterium]